MNDHRRSGRAASSAERQASEWLVLLDSGSATDEDRARFEAWLAEDAGYREAYAGLLETWERLAALRGCVRAANPGKDPRSTELRKPGPLRMTRRRSLVAAFAAAALVAVVSSGILLLVGDSAIPYRTDVGEMRTVSLNDGSSIELNTDTELLVEYAPEKRTVVVTRGEAYFDIAEDSDRPFVVLAGHAAIRAVGTALMVRLEAPSQVLVMVTEGVVEVARPTHGVDTGRSPDADPALLRPGQRAKYDQRAIHVEEIPRGEVERVQAWRRGLLVFENSSLTDVVAEVQRYTETRLVLADPELGELRIGGTFDSGEVDAFLEVLDKVFGIRIAREGRNTIVLRGPADSSTRSPP